MDKIGKKTFRSLDIDHIIIHEIVERVTALKTSILEFVFSLLKAGNGHQYKIKQWGGFMKKYANLLQESQKHTAVI